MARNIISRLGFVVVMIAAQSFAVSAQQPPQRNTLNSIEVLVNDEPISTHDINQRLRLVVAISGGVKDEQEFLKVREQVIRTMVDERLQIQEAQEVSGEVLQGAELERYFARRAEGIGQTPDQFEQSLASIGSSKRSMMDQLHAEVVWAQLVQGRLGPFVTVSDEEVEESMERIHNNRGKFEYRLAEIVLLVDSPNQEGSVKSNAEQLVARIKEGAIFAELAQQLSSASSAARGGDLGWTTEGEMDPYQAKVVNELGVGEVADPIRTPGGYIILALRDRRRVLTADPLDARLTIRQLHLSNEKIASDPEASGVFETAVAAISSDEATCSKVPEYAEQTGADGPQEIGALRLRDLTGEARASVTDIEIGKPSQLLHMEDGMRVLFVCDRQEPVVQEPDFDQIHDQINQQRMSMMARRYLRDIRRDAIIDYR